MHWNWIMFFVSFYLASIPGAILFSATIVEYKQWRFLPILVLWLAGFITTLLLLQGGLL